MDDIDEGHFARDLRRWCGDLSCYHNNQRRKHSATWFGQHSEMDNSQTSRIQSEKVSPFALFGKTTILCTKNTITTKWYCYIIWNDLKIFSSVKKYTRLLVFKVIKRIRYISALFSYGYQRDWITLFKNVAVSTLDYCSTVFCPRQKTQINSLEAVVKEFLRLGLLPNVSSEETHKSFHTTLKGFPGYTSSEVSSNCGIQTVS